MAAEIHSTAVIHPKAVIGDGVFVGPYCVIGEGVEIGEGSWLQNHVTMCGPSKIGRGNRFHAFTSIGQQTQDLKYAGEPTYLEVGDENVFREFCTVNRGTLPGTRTVVGSHNHFLSYCHIAHDCVVGDHVIFSNNGTLAGHVVVEDHVILGGLTAVHQFCRLGKHSITGGCSKIVQDCMPFTIVDGNPARTRSINQVGMQRKGYDEAQVLAVRQAFKMFFRAKLNMAQALEKLKSGQVTPEVAHMIAFAEGSQRGLVGA